MDMQRTNTKMRRILLKKYYFIALNSDDSYHCNWKMWSLLWDVKLYIDESAPIWNHKIKNLMDSIQWIK